MRIIAAICLTAMSLIATSANTARAEVYYPYHLHQTPHPLVHHQPIVTYPSSYFHHPTAAEYIASPIHNPIQNPLLPVQPAWGIYSYHVGPYRYLNTSVIKYRW